LRTGHGLDRALNVRDTSKHKRPLKKKKKIISKRGEIFFILLWLVGGKVKRKCQGRHTFMTGA
jgi:hypothetical protein